MYRNWLFLITFVLIACKNTDSSAVLIAVPEVNTVAQESGAIPGAEHLQQYVPKLKEKRVGLVVNQASLVRKTHLLDTLLSLDINVNKIFVPEHGFRGKEDAGAKIKDDVDTRSGLPIVSLYGKNRKPPATSLADLDILVFDLQDVGVRCYTYISTLHYVMEACAELGLPLIVLDRPNPNAHYVDGPVLEKQYASFVGMHPVPFVYGMTIGEYALMIKGEKWINAAESLVMEVVTCTRYDHDTQYPLPVAPSPNLPSYESVLLYPSLVLFEGTVVSVGRGTDQPFEIFGHPTWHVRSFAFTPRSGQGAKYPKLEGETCLGFNLGNQDPFILKSEGFQLKYLIDAFNLGPQEDFFLPNLFFDKLAGTDQLRMMIAEGKTEDEIRESWSEGIDAFKVIRDRYLLYQQTVRN